MHVPIQSNGAQFAIVYILKYKRTFTIFVNCYVILDSGYGIISSPAT